jgi:hypothetical protein
MKWKCRVVVKVRGWIVCPDAFYLTISLSAGAGRERRRGGSRGPTRTGGWCLFTDPPLTLSTHSKSPLSFLFSPPLSALLTHSRPLSTLLSPLSSSSTLCPLPSPRRRQLMEWKCRVVVKVRGWIACPDAFYLTISLFAGAGRERRRGGRGGRGGRRGWLPLCCCSFLLTTLLKKPAS